MATTTSELIQRDHASVWHPFLQILKGEGPIPIVAAKNATVIAEDGTHYLDAISSWFVNLHGHNHPYIANKIKAQLDQLAHVMFADFTHEPAIELAERLLAILPGNLSKIFYTDNGSTAVEAALKIALQYWHNQNKPEKKKILCFKQGYHGDTFGAMSVSEKSLFSRPFWSHLFQVEMIPVPFEEIPDIEPLLQQGDVACFIFEPILLGVGGMHIYPAEHLDALLALCKKYQVLTIADEVLTGFGRTGPLFACEYLQNTPDMICLSKGLTGGFLPLGALACTQNIYEAFSNQDPRLAFLHGHSFTGNPLSCAAALASLDLTEASDTQRHAIACSHAAFCRRYANHPALLRCRSLGTILILEYKTSAESSYFNPLRERLYRFFLGKNIILRPFGNTIYVFPPYCITPEELDQIYQALIETLEFPC